LLANDVLVRIGGGRKSHVFRPHPNANLKRFELQDGGTVYDIALCGSRGAMVTADADDDLCGTCGAQLERD
jgi:hypothetical protein